ncbi:MAG: glycosyltransferase family 1 protein [Candidatus Rokuibacteriota bacterium]|nr:MAG: glycosyltransferase family 1 protein [Candidatus Rokubacteria bacterium]
MTEGVGRPRAESRLRVGLDARKLDDFGIGTYIRGLLGAVARAPAPPELVVYLPPGRARPVPEPADGAIAWREEAARPYSGAELWRLAVRARQDGVTVFHAPHYVCPPLLPCPAVVTIHDLIHLRFRQRHPGASLYAHVMLRLAAWRAARLIAVSESTRRDLETRLRASPGKIRVIPNGVDPAFRALPDGVLPTETLAALGLRTPYFLFVGNPLPHKNLPRLLDAFAGLPPALGSLVLAGIPRRAQLTLTHDCARRGLDARVTILAPVPAATMPALYQGALALVSPSLWEGFGLPALEAMACGTPVLAADRGALPEVVGDAGLLVDPTSVDALREAMYTLAVQPSLRAALRVAGPARARAFSWRHVAEATIAVYREAWQGSGNAGDAGRAGP